MDEVNRINEINEINELKYIANVIKEAGVMALEISKKEIKKELKEDKTIVTNVDLSTQDFILKKFKSQKSPIKDYIVIAEEFYSYKNSNPHRTYISVDPIDGTKGLISDRDYTIMCGKVLNGKPSFAVVYHPKKQMMFMSHKKISVLLDFDSNIIQKMSISKTKKLNEAKILVGYTDSVKRKIEIDKLIKKGLNIKILDSTGFKGGLVASGVADGYIMFPRKMATWDLVPPVAIVENSGGKVTTISGKYPEFTKTIVDQGVVLTNSKIHSELLKEVNSVL